MKRLLSAPKLLASTITTVIPIIGGGDDKKTTLRYFCRLPGRDGLCLLS